MYNDQDFEFFVEHLKSDDEDDRGYAARASSKTEAEGDKRLLPLLEPLLQDKRFTITGGMPPRYCEVRLLAAKAINRQRKLLGLPGKVSLTGFVYPGSYGMMVVFAERQHGFKKSDFPYGADTFEKLEHLQNLNVLPVFTSDKYPYLDYSTLPRRDDED